MKRKASTSHDEAIVQRFPRKDPDFATEYLKASLEDGDKPGFCSLPCATSPRLKASPRLLKLPASSARESL